MARRRVNRRAVHSKTKAKTHKSRVARAKDIHVGHKGQGRVRTVNAPKTW